MYIQKGDYVVVNNGTIIYKVEIFEHDTHFLWLEDGDGHLVIYKKDAKKVTPEKNPELFI